jgi:hypothetical protein
MTRQQEFEKLVALWSDAFPGEIGNGEADKRFSLASLNLANFVASNADCITVRSGR